MKVESGLRSLWEAILEMGSLGGAEEGNEVNLGCGVWGAYGASGLRHPGGEGSAEGSAVGVIAGR